MPQSPAVKVQVAVITVQPEGPDVRKLLRLIADRLRKTNPTVHVTESSPPGPDDQRTVTILWKQESKNPLAAVQEAEQAVQSHRRPGEDLPRLRYKADEVK